MAWLPRGDRMVSQRVSQGWSGEVEGANTDIANCLTGGLDSNRDIYFKFIEMEERQPRMSALRL